MENISVDKNEIRRNKLCTISLIVSGIITVLFMMFTMAPLLSTAAGMFVYLILGMGAGLISFASLGMVWIDEGFRNKWQGAFDFAKKLMNNGVTIAETIGKNVIWISIIAFCLCSFGFIINMISYHKHKDHRYKLVMSIACLCIAVICLIASNIVYLTYKDNPPVL